MLEGCSAAPAPNEGAAGENGEAITVPIRILPFITAHTSAPTPNAAVCASKTVAAPPALMSNGCTWGVEFTNDPIYRQGYAWACKLPVDPPESGFGLPNPEPISGTAFGEYAFATTTPATNSCWGTPDAGYALVINDFKPTIGGGGCRGTGCGAHGQ
jgi:hypothetical protein